MKKLLLTASAAMISLAMFGQDVETFSAAWTAKKGEVSKKSLIVLDFTTDSIFNESGFNPNNKFGDKIIETSAENSYDVTYDAAEKAVKIAYKYLGSATNDNYSGTITLHGGYKKVNDSVAPNTSKFNPFLEADKIEGNAIDFSNIENRQVRVTYKLKNNDDSASMRVDIYDINGRKSNGDVSSCKKQINTKSGWSTVTYTWGNDLGDKAIGGWNEDAAGITIQDWYSGDFWGVKTGRWNAAEVQSGLPVYDGYKVDLDSNYILPQILVQLNSGGKGDAWVKAMAAGELDKEFDVYIQKVEMGDLAATDGITYPAPASVAPIVDIKVGQFGNVFTFEGTASLVNVLGQTVATGTSSIDASSLAAGIYFIVIDGVAKEVVVK